MSSIEASLQVGVRAYKQKRYAEAIEAFQQVYEAADPGGQLYLQAQAWLVRAYGRNHEPARALQLCRDLALCPIPTIQEWAQERLPRLETALAEAKTDAGVESPPSEATTAVSDAETAPAEAVQGLEDGAAKLPPEEAAQIFDQGMRSLRQGRYAEAISNFRTFLRGSDDTYPNYAWAQTSLVKAYRRDNQPEAAIALAQALVRSNRESTRAWAQDFLKSMSLQQGTAVAADKPAAAGRSQAVAEQAPQGPATVRRSSSPSQTPRRPTRQRPPGDITPQVLSGLAHGSISLFASLLLWMLFPDSWLANVLGFLRFLVPVAILLNTRDPLVKANAKEATNYVITSLLLTLVVVIFGVFLLLGLFAIAVVAWPLVILLGIPLGLYFLALSIWPIIATVASVRQGGQVFRYPNWLIWHPLQ